MRKGFKYCLLYILPLEILSFSCREKYEPPVITTDLKYLVVDGVLINGSDSSIIRLSRTKTIDKDPATSGEQNAQMTVDDSEGNTLYTFVQINDKGVYAVPPMSLDVNKKYRLRINTVDGNQYVSDDITIKDTPPIDSISWQRLQDGVAIYANTHDPLNDTKYYRWEYIETWDYFTRYMSAIKYQASDTTLVLREPGEFIDHCWKTINSNGILLSSSAKLSADVINLGPLRFIPENSFELSSVYSILVKQYALTKEAFEYFENIKKISEQTGSLFDPQPSQLSGNIHSIAHPGEPVIGYITASSLQQQRIFIRKEQVDPWNYAVDCPDLKMISRSKDSLEFFFGGKHPLRIPVEEVPFGGINAAIPACADCTTYGGVTIKPAFWP